LARVLTISNRWGQLASKEQKFWGSMHATQSEVRTNAGLLLIEEVERGNAADQGQAGRLEGMA
jgi:hypothetical protein